MSKGAKKIFVLILTVLFLLIGLGMVLYSQGYRVDFKKRKIVQTGGLYFKVWPPGVEVYLNGKMEKKTSFLFNSAFIENLLPKVYEIEIKKQDFHSWKKNLEVKEKWVTEAKNIILFQRDPIFSFLQKPIKNFWPSPDNKKIIYEKNNVLEILDLEKNKTEILFQKELIGKLTEIDWTIPPTKILLKIETEEQQNFFVFELSGKSPLSSLQFLGQNAKNFSFHPKDPSKIFFLKENRLFETDYLVKTQKLILDNVISYSILDENLIWLDPRGFVYRSDLSGRTLGILNLKPIEIIPETEYRILGSDFSKIFLKKSSTLFYLDPELKSFTKISDNIKNLKFSPSLKKAVYFSENEIWILFLEDLPEQPPRKLGEKIFLARFSEKIKNLFWLTDHYLIFNVGNVIKISEIDDRDRINIVDLTEFKNPELFFNQADKKLYILSSENLYQSEKLIP